LESILYKYEVGDIVETPWGPGKIAKDLGYQPPRDHDYVIHFSTQAMNKYGLDKSDVKISSFQLSGIIKKYDRDPIGTDNERKYQEYVNNSEYQPSGPATQSGAADTLQARSADIDALHNA